MPRQLIGSEDQTGETVQLKAPDGSAIIISHPERILWHRVRTTGIRKEGGEVRVRPLLVGEKMGQNLQYERSETLRSILQTWENEGLVKIIALRGTDIGGTGYSVQVTPKGVLYIPPMIPPTR